MDRYLIYLAYHYYLRDEPFPTDLFLELSEAGIAPEHLERAFANGDEPPFDEEE